MNHAWILKCILEMVGLFRERQQLEQPTTLQSSRKPPTNCWQAVGPQKAACSGCVSMWQNPGWNGMSGRKALHCNCLHCRNVNWCTSFSERLYNRIFLSGELWSSPKALNVCFGPCAGHVCKFDLMENVDYCFKILYWHCCLYFSLFLNCFLQTLSLPICALLCQETDFPVKHFSDDRYY